MKSNLLLIIFLIGVFNIALSQNEAKFYNTDTIYFLGYDFTHFTLGEPERKKENLDKYILGWGQYLDDKLNLYKPYSYFDWGCIIDYILKTEITPTYQHHKLNENVTNFVAFSGERISLDTIKKMVENYKVEIFTNNTKVNIEKGIGLISIIEYADKLTESACVSLVFFDIKTRHFIRYTSILEGAQGLGLTKHYGRTFADCIEECLYYYVADVPEEEWKQKKKVWDSN